MINMVMYNINMGKKGFVMGVKDSCYTLWYKGIKAEIENLLHPNKRAMELLKAE